MKPTPMKFQFDVIYVFISLLLSVRRSVFSLPLPLMFARARLCPALRACVCAREWIDAMLSRHARSIVLTMKIIVTGD